MTGSSSSVAAGKSLAATTDYVGRLCLLCGSLAAPSALSLHSCRRAFVFWVRGHQRMGLWAGHRGQRAKNGISSRGNIGRAWKGGTSALLRRLHTRVVSGFDVEV